MCVKRTEVLYIKDTEKSIPLGEVPVYNSSMQWPFHLHRTKNNQHVIIYIICTAVVAMGISLWIGLQQSVWFDEAYSVLVAQHEPAQIIQLASVDVHPPMYYLLLHVWGNAFGWSDLPLRLVSVLAFGGAVVVAGLLARRLFGDKVAAVAVTAVALSPLLLRYGFEIRMYSLASLLGVLATYVLVCARTAGKRALWLWVAYAVLVALGQLTLYHLALLWVAHVLWLLYTDRRNLKHFWQLPWVRAYALALLLFLPWLPKFISQFGNGALANIGQPMSMEQLLGVVSFSILYKPLWQVTVFETLILLAVIALGVWAWLKAYKQKQTRSQLLLLLAYIAVPVALFMLVSFVRPSYVERYLAHVAIGLLLLMGVLAARAIEPFKQRGQLAVYATGLFIFGVGIFNLAAMGNYNFQRMQRPVVAEAASVIDCTGATVIAADPYVATELSYYLPTTCDMRFYSQWDKMGGGYAPFSESPLQLHSTTVGVFTNKLYYAYYDKPMLFINPTYHQVNNFTKGGLTVQEYQAS